MDSEIKYPTPEQAERLHERVLGDTRGERGNLSRSNLEYLLDTVRDIGEGNETRQALVKKAAFLLYNLILLHPFINGNKRTAVELVRLFLQVNGLELRVNEDDAYAFAIDIASRRALKGDVEAWIARNLTEFQEK